MAKANPYHLVYRKLSDSGNESVEVFTGSKGAVMLLIEEIEKEQSANVEVDDIIGVFHGKKISYSTEVKVEVTLN